MINLISRIRNEIRCVLNNNRNMQYVKKCDNKFEIKEIEIETVNRCNGKCSFCPVNVNEPQREYAKMPTELFQKIINELAQLEYKNKISIYSNNEPFLDSRIVEFYKYAKKKLPNAYFNLFTNGSLLTLDNFKEIVQYVDNMVIDNYNDDLEVNRNLQEVYNYLEQHKELHSKVNFAVRMQNEVRFSRGGQAPNKKEVKGINELCLLPFRQMVIRPTGEVSLCCNDALGKYTLGNVNEENIETIWNSRQYNEIRDEMKKNLRKNLFLCKNCDTKTAP